MYWAKFKGKRFSDAKCPGPLLQRSPLNATVAVNYGQVADGSTRQRQLADLQIE